MKFKKICKLPECSKEFETDAHNAEFCSNAHYHKFYRKHKKELGRIPDANTLARPFANAPTMAPAKAAIPQLDTLGSFMVRTVERERDKLDTELTDLKKKYESLKEKNSDLEKQLDNATRAIGEKPSGLMGLLQANPSWGDKALEMGMPLLNTLAEKLMSPTTPQNQLAAPDQNANPVWVWLVSQPKEIIDQFVMLLEKLDGLEKVEKKKDYLEAWNRSLMSVRKTSPTVSATATHR